MVWIAFAWIGAAPPATSHSKAYDQTPASTYVSPVITSTPSADGAIIHVVQYGQTLYSIAEAYGVTIDQIKALNNLTSNDIYVGNKLIIRLGNTATATGLPTNTPTRTPRPTHTATRIPSTRTPTRTPTVLDETQAALAQAGQLPKTGSNLTRLDPMLLVIAGLAVVGVGMMVIGSLLKKRP